MVLHSAGRQQGKVHLHDASASSKALASVKSRQATSPPNVRTHSTIAGKSNRADKSAVFGEPAIVLRHQLARRGPTRGRFDSQAGRVGLLAAMLCCLLNDSPALAGHLHGNEEHRHKNDQSNCRDGRSCRPSLPKMTLADAVERPCRYCQDAGPLDGREEAPKHPCREQSQPNGQDHPAKTPRPARLPNSAGKSSVDLGQRRI